MHPVLEHIDRALQVLKRVETAMLSVVPGLKREDALIDGHIGSFYFAHTLEAKTLALTWSIGAENTDEEPTAESDERTTFEVQADLCFDVNSDCRVRVRYSTSRGVWFTDHDVEGDDEAEALARRFPTGELSEPQAIELILAMAAYFKEKSS